MEPNKETAKKHSAAKQNNLPSKASPKTTSLALPDDLQGAWGAEGSTSKDIIIPKILLMHGQSELVLSGERQSGQLIKSTDHALVADRGATVKIIPFKMFKTWRVSELASSGQYEWRREEPWTVENDELPWEFEETDGPTTKKMRRDQAYNFYAILADEIGTGEVFPVKLQFTRTSRKAGKTLANHFATSGMYRRPPAMQTFEIGSEFVNGDKQKYFVFTAKMGQASSIEQLRVVKQWYDLIASGASSVKEHEANETTVAPLNEETAEY